MSRIGRAPINIPSEVNCSLEEGVIMVHGSLGTMNVIIPKGFNVDIAERVISVSLKNPAKPMAKKMSMLYGTLCRTVINVILGVSRGFERKLELIGVGYRAEVQGGKILKLNLGYSHDVLYPIPQGITIVSEKPTLLKITGIDKQRVGQTAAEIIKFRPPEPYKGKGIHVPGAYIRRKEGKKK